MAEQTAAAAFRRTLSGGTSASKSSPSAGGPASTPIDDGVQRIGRYEVLGELGRGAMGAVYRARDPQIASLSCRRFVASSFSLDLMARRYAAVYETAIAERQALRRPSPRAARPPQSGVAPPTGVPVA